MVKPSPPSSRPPPRSRARKGEGHRLRDELLSATSDLLATLDDPGQLSMRSVAAAVGVTPPSIYRHFPDKQALLVAVVTRQWEEFHHLLVGAAAVGKDPFDGLRRFCSAYLHFAEERPGHYRVLFGGPAPAGITLDDPARHPGLPTFAALVELVQGCLDGGAHTQEGRDSWFLALQVWLSGHGLVDLRLGQRFPFPWPPAEALLDAMLTDLGLAGARGSIQRGEPSSATRAGLKS